MRVRFGCVFVLLAAASCSDRAVSRQAEEWVVSPDELIFENAVVGVRSRSEVRLTNLSRSPVRISLGVNEPFFVETETVELVGGQQKVVLVSLFASGPGTLSEKLQLRSHDVERNVALLAEVKPASPCLPRNACEQVAVESVTQECVRTAKPDGTTCENACLENGTCSGGECKGTAKRCDDADPCTFDFCGEASGCGHTAVECPAAADPCQVPFCDSSTGCALAPAADGTRCGPADCKSADICLQGICKTAAVPEGSACGEASPCQPEGTCRAQVCERAAPTLVQPSWTYASPLGARLVSGGVGGPDGAFYFVEEDATTSWFVCLSLDGVLRYRQPMGRLVAPSSVFLSGLRFVIFGTDDWVEARDIRNGSLWWRRVVSDYLSPVERDRLPAAPHLEWSAAADSGLGFAYAGLEISDSASPNPRWIQFLFALDLATGQAIWKEDRTGPDHRRIHFLVADEAGNAYFQETLTTMGVGYHFVSVNRMGQERWRKPVASPWLQAVHGGRLVSSSALYDTADGSEQPWNAQGYGAVIDENAVYRWVYAPSRAIERSNWVTGHTDWQVPMPASNLIVLGNRDLLAFTGDDLVTELTSTGQVLYQCRLNGAVLSTALLNDDGWLVSSADKSNQVSSYKILDRAPASSGWVNEWGGSPARGNRPR